MRKKKQKNGSGLINGMLDVLSEKLRSMIDKSLVGHLFTSNKSLERKANNSFCVGTVAAGTSKYANSLRRTMLKQTDQSIFVRCVRAVGNYLYSCKVNWYGVYFLTFGIYALILNLIKSASSGLNDFSLYFFIEDESIWSFLVMAIAIPLLTANESLCSMINKSKLIKNVLLSYGGVPENKFKDITAKNKYNSYFVAAILGMITGGITFFIPPYKVVLSILTSLALAVFVNFPEIGVVTTIFVVPFLGLFKHPTTILVTMVMITFVSYLLKLFVGKRSIKFRFSDIIMLIMLLMFLFGGIITVGGKESFDSALAYSCLMLIYVLVVNLMNTKQLMERCVAAIAVPSVIVSFLGIVGYAFTEMSEKWIDSAMFAEIANRTTSTFENPNMLATYLILTAPFIWIYAFGVGVSIKTRLVAIIGSLASAVCVALTWSRGGWIGFVIAAITFCVINYKNTLKYILAGVLTSPLWTILIPNAVKTRFLSIGDLSDSSTYYRLYTWKGALRLLKDHFFSGIGVGEGAFSQLYPLYSYIGNESTMHSHSLFLEITIELGIVGSLLFVFIMLVTMQKGFSEIRNCGEKNRRIIVSAAVVGLVAALVHGVVDYIWYNYRVFFVFWLVVAVIRAYSDIGDEEDTVKKISLFAGRERSASIELTLDK